MLKAILVDDEKPALKELEYLLKDYPEICIVGAYRDPFEAIDKIKELKPDVVFLDINMPKLNGMDAALRIQDSCPGTNIVFVTAYDQYAIEAFELHALDYVLKPVETTRFEKTITRIMSRKSNKVTEHPQKLSIKSLGKFTMGWVGQTPIKWRTEKTKELFVFLLANVGRGFTKDELLDKLWCDDDPDKAIKQLYNGVYYIRKALDDYGIERSLLSITSDYKLVLGAVDFDMKRFSELEKSETFEDLRTMETLYSGQFLEGEDYDWAYPVRENMEKKYVQCLIKLSAKYTSDKHFDLAAEQLEKAYKINPYEDAVSELLLRHYKETGEKIKAVRHFNAHAKLLEDELGIKPCSRLVALYQTIK